jgi:hypothetical protein
LVFWTGRNEKLAQNLSTSPDDDKTMGWFYDWTYSRGPFERMFNSFGEHGKGAEFWSLWMSILIIIMGWKFRFQIGACTISIYFGFMKLVKLIFKKI